MADHRRPRRLVVLADSLAFHGPAGPLPVGDPRLYPQRLAARLGDRTGDRWDVDVVARAGWSVRDLRLALGKDVHVGQGVVAGADAVVLAVGSTDTLSVALPRSAVAVLPFVRPPVLRRRLRALLNRRHAALVGATGGRVRFTPRGAYRDAWRACVATVRGLAPGAALCAALPARHRAPHYAGIHRFLADGIADTRALAAEAGVPVVDVPALMDPFMGSLNPDGIHWPFALHDAAAAAFADALAPALRRRTRTP